LTKPSCWQLRFTGFGITWLIGCSILFILALNYSNNLLLFVALLLLVLLVNSAWFSWLQVRSFSVNTVLVKPVYAEQNAQINIQVSNPKGKIPLALQLYSPELNTEAAMPLTNKSLFSTTLNVNHLNRGRFKLAHIVLQTHSVLSLWHWKKQIPSEATLWVYPAPQGKQAIPKPKAKQGTYLKKEQGDFSHVRVYQRGDSLNHIAWKQMARTGTVMTKEFDGGEGLRQTILSYQDLKGSNTEHKLSQLCRWILDCHQKQLKYSLELPRKTIAAAQGEAHKETCLQALAQFGLTLPTTESAGSTQ